jgi:NTE family protein
MEAQIGVALSCGGVKGIAHVGVLKALEEVQVPIHMLAGTSMGGAVAAAYAAGLCADEIEAAFRSVRLLDIAQHDRSGLGLLGREKIAEKLREILGGDLTFDQLERPLALVAADLNSGEEVVLREGSVIDAVLATTSVPVVFPPFCWRGRWLIDGAIINPLPMDVVRAMGADRVIAVHAVDQFPAELRMDDEIVSSSTEAFMRFLLQRVRWTPLMNVSVRSLSVLNRELVRQRVRQTPPDLMIEVPLRDVKLFALEQLEWLVASGAEAAHQHRPALAAMRDEPRPGRLVRWWRSLGTARAGSF